MKIPLVFVVLLFGHFAMSDVNFEAGQNALLLGDIDAAIEIFDNLALFGDDRAAAAAEQLRALSNDERQQYLSQIASDAMKSGNLDEAERLFSILLDQAAERDDQGSVEVFAQVLALVEDAKEQAAADQILLASTRCETTVSIQSGSIETNDSENCPIDASESLVARHRDEVETAVRGMQESGALDGSVLIITDEQTSPSTTFSEEAEEAEEAQETEETEETEEPSQ